MTFSVTQPSRSKPMLEWVIPWERLSADSLFLRHCSSFPRFRIMHPPPTNNEDDPMESFSLDRRMPQMPLSSARAKPVIYWFRIIVWLSPGPTWVMLLGALTWCFNGFLPEPDPIPLILIVIFTSIISAFGIGCFDACLSENVAKENGLPLLPNALRHACFFSGMQIIVAPVSLLLFGFTMVFLASVFAH